MTRKIIVDGVAYGWRVAHRHASIGAPGEASRQCSSEFVAFLAGRGGAALRVRFVEPEAAPAGYVERIGVVFLSGEEPCVLNLNEPRVAAALIRLGRSSGWRGEREFVVEDGRAYVSRLGAAGLRKITWGA